MADDSESHPETDAGPGTEPFVPDFDTGRHLRPRSDPSDFDTGAHSRPLTEPFVPDFDTGADSVAFPAVARDQESAPDPLPSPTEGQHTGSSVTTTKVDSEVVEPAVEVAAPVQPVTVPGRYYYLKWWKLALMLLSVWIAAAPIGSGLFYWWTEDRSLHKTPVVFVVLIYVVVCTVGGLMLAMVEARPLVAALAIAVMSAPLASVAGAAPFYGAFACNHMADACFLGIIPF